MDRCLHSRSLPDLMLCLDKWRSADCRRNLGRGEAGTRIDTAACRRLDSTAISSQALVPPEQHPFLADAAGFIRHSCSVRLKTRLWFTFGSIFLSIGGVSRVEAHELQI